MLNTLIVFRATVSDMQKKTTDSFHASNNIMNGTVGLHAFIRDTQTIPLSPRFKVIYIYIYYEDRTQGTAD